MSTASRRSGVTITDVAAQAGVSPAAVSKVFNGKGKISVATAERIRTAARELGWSPSASAVALRRSRSTTIGLVLDRSARPPAIGDQRSLLIEGIESVLAPRDYGLLLHLSDHSPAEDERVYRLMADSKRVDGVILIESGLEDIRFALLEELQLPAVLLGTPWKQTSFPHVDADPPAAGIPESVQLLAGLGHRRIAYIGGPEGSAQAQLRRVAYEEAMAVAGLTSVATINAEYSARAGAANTSRVLASADRPTAIMYGSDSMAIAGIKTARLHGMSVPDQLSVVGFEGLAVGEWIDPQLTTVQRNPAQRGRAAAARLLRLLGDESVDVHPLEQPYLIVRGSTGLAPVD